MADKAATIEGILERVIYHNEENGYTVAAIQEHGKAGTTTATGVFTGINEGENLQIHGQWNEHPRFGRQFQFESYRVVPPSSLNGIERYLASGIIPGIGKKMAQRLVKQFGLETLVVMEKEPDRLKEINGLGKKKIAKIIDAFQEQKAVQDVMVFLQSYGITTGQAHRIYEEYGNSAIEVIRSNPYQLSRDIHGIGFKIADQVARNLGIPRESNARIDAGILYVLTRLSDDGHVCYPREQLLAEAQRILEVTIEQIESAIDRQLSQRELVQEEHEPGQMIFLSRHHRSEVNAARRLLALMNGPSSLPDIRVNQAIEWAQKQSKIDLAEKQKAAIASALTEKVSVITGGPGVGKTTVINAILLILETKGQQVHLAAPTGRAAKRLNESTGSPAKTLHRLLKFNPSLHRFDANENNPLEGDVFIVDECSMIDISLMNHLLNAIPPRGHLLLVGDADQLPSVGPGNVLGDIIASGLVPVTHLDVIFRQATRSTIIDWAHDINHGFLPEKPSASDSLSDLYFIEKKEPEDSLDVITRLFTERIPERFKFHPVKDIQLLTPMHKGILGVGNLNSELQASLNPVQSSARKTPGGLFEGDKVMQIRNNYEKEVFNGDIGFVTHIDPVDSKAIIEIDEREIEYSFSSLNEVIPAYAISIHKSQGSEYPAVVIPVVTQHYVMLQRNLIYTAITRARELVVMVGTYKALRIAVQQESGRSRFTGFEQRLVREQEEFLNL